MAIDIKVDSKEVEKNLMALLDKSKTWVEKASMDLASEILRLSSFEVPHDKGLLQSSGMVEAEEKGAIVGYNKVYAARLHENPQYHFQGGRKGKYLEDPIKKNMKVFLDFIGNIIKGEL